MRARLILAALAVLALGCPRPAPHPGPGDTTVVVPDTTVVDTSADTAVVVPDTSVAPDTSAADSADVQPDPTHDAGPEDTLPPPSAIRRAIQPGGPDGLPIGPSAPKTDQIGAYGTTGAYQGVGCNLIPGILRASALRHFARIITMPRTKQTANGTNDGAWSPTNIKRELDCVARIPTDTIRKYVDMGVFKTYNIGDDPACPICWGAAGNIVTPQQMAEVYAYAKQVLPDFLPLSIRLHPSWARSYPQLSLYVDDWIMQYVAPRGDLPAWLAQQAKFNATLPHPGRLVVFLNTYNFDPKVTRKITADELRTFGMIALAYPGSCFFGGFKWWSGWRDQGRGAVWDSLVAKARTMEPVSCKAPSPTEPVVNRR